MGDLEDGAGVGGEFGGVVVAAFGRDFGGEEGLRVGPWEELDGIRTTNPSLPSSPAMC